MLNTTSKIGKVTYNGRNIKLLTGSQVVTNGSIVIRVTDMAGTVVNLLDIDLNVLQTKTVGANGGIVDFTLSSTGTYFVQNVTKGWQKSVSVNQIGLYNVRGEGILNNYTKQQLHEICQAGYFSSMFELGDTWTLVDPDSIFNNYKFFVERVIQNDDGTETVCFRMLDYYRGASYDINPRYYYLSSATATSWSNNSSSVGGMQFSAMMNRMRKAGEDAWSQATSIKPNGSSLATGIEFSKLYYTDGGGRTSAIYNYDMTTGEMTVLEEFVAGSTCRFVKGYFLKVGTIDEATFNAGYYYTYANNIYTQATTYSASTTYYGFYETIQEDGIFLKALNSIESNLVQFSRTGSTGSTNTSQTQTFDCYVDLPVAEEMFGYNRTHTLVNGVSAINAGFYNIPGEGEKLDVYDFKLWTIGAGYWTMSVSSNGATSFCYVYNSGYISNGNVGNANYVRPGFRFS